MRILVFSDIHANLTALEAVLADAGEVDAAWCLGDVVGYGPDPNECIALVQELPNLICLLGNHDAAAIGKLDLKVFNSEAQRSLRWLKGVLGEHEEQFLLQRKQTMKQEQVMLVHGSPRDPTMEYVLDTRTANSNFPHFETDFCFFGHTHIPSIFTQQNSDSQASFSVPPLNLPTPLVPRTMVNPGSVGQPRDRDPRASYAIYNTNGHTWEARRAEYEIAAVQSRMRQVGLPERHILRLEGGW